MSDVINTRNTWETKGWEKLAESSAGIPAVEAKILERNGPRMLISARSCGPVRASAAALRRVVYDNLSKFGMHGAGVEAFGGIIPLWNGDTIAGYEQQFKVLKPGI